MTVRPTLGEINSSILSILYKKIHTVPTSYTYLQAWRQCNDHFENGNNAKIRNSGRLLRFRFRSVWRRRLRSKRGFKFIRLLSCARAMALLNVRGFRC